MISSRASTMVVEPCSNHPFTPLQKAARQGLLLLPGSGCPLEVSKTQADARDEHRNTHYRYLAFADGSEPRDVDAGRQAIYDAILTRDADHAVAAANLHIHKTTDSVVAGESDFAGIARVA